MISLPHFVFGGGPSRLIGHEGVAGGPCTAGAKTLTPTRCGRAIKPSTPYTVQPAANGSLIADAFHSSLPKASRSGIFFPVVVDGCNHPRLRDIYCRKCCDEHKLVRHCIPEGLDKGLLCTSGGTVVVFTQFRWSADGKEPAPAMCGWSDPGGRATLGVKRERGPLVPLG